jgi:hypothetical protein
LFLLVPAIRADDFSVNFSAANQNMWGTGAAAQFDANYSLGGPWDQSLSLLPGIWTDPVLGTQWGGTLDTRTWGTAQIGLNIHADAGSVNASYPANISVNLPTQAAPGQTIQITSALNIGSGSLTTAFSHAQLSSSATLEVHGSFKSQLCTGFCYPEINTGDLTGWFWGEYDPNADNSVELFAYNNDDDGILTLLGTDVSTWNFGDKMNIPPIGPKLGDVTINTPNLNLTGTPDGGGLSASGGLDVVTAHITPTGESFALDVAIFKLTASLFEANIGLAAGLDQDFYLDNPESVLINLLVEETGENLQFYAGGTVPYTLPSGYALDELHFIPSFDLANADLTNTTSVSIGGELSIQALEFCYDIPVLVLGGCAGPVWDASYGSLTDPNQRTVIPVFDQIFGLDFAPIAGQTMILQVVEQQEVPEPASMVLFASGLAVLAVKKRLMRSRSR